MKLECNFYAIKKGMPFQALPSLERTMSKDLTAKANINKKEE